MSFPKRWPEALRALKEDRFDLLLLDIQMPGQGGEDAVRDSLA